MGLFKKTQPVVEATKHSQVQKKLDLETLIDELAAQPPKAMEKIMALAKARREYNQKLKSLQQSLEGVNSSEEETPEPETPFKPADNDIEETLEALKEYNELDDHMLFGDDYIETEPTPPNKKKAEKKTKN